MRKTVKWRRFVTKNLAAIAGSWCLLATAVAAAATGPGAGRLEEVVIVFKTHFDIGYTDMAANVVQRYRTTMIDQALQVVDQNRSLPPEQQFVWTVPGWPMSKILDDWPGQTPERKQKIRQAIREGRFVVHALPFSMHTESLELEDLVFGLGFASRTSRALGLELPRDAKMTDVVCHTWMLSTLLAHAGVEFLHIGCNSACSSPEVPPLFWWQGPDGSRLLTMYSAGGYGTGLVPPPDWPHRTWLALIHTGDNHGPPRPEEVKKLLDEARVKLPGVKVRIGRLSDFADRLRAEKPELPVVRGDTPDSWIHGPMCDPAGAKLARHVRPAILALQSLNTELRGWGAEVPEIAASLATARENSLLYGEHTWGGALWWLTPYGKGINFHYGDIWRSERAQGRFQKLEASWAEHTAYIETAERIVRPLLDAHLQTLARAVGVNAPRIVVYNPLPWRRDGFVRAPLAGTVAALRATDDRQIVPVEPGQGVVGFVARNVPAMGYRTYVPVKGEAAALLPGGDAKSAVIESRFFRAALDPARGTIRSLVDKRSGRELLDTAGPYGFGQYLYERFDADQVSAYAKSYIKIKADWPLAEIGKPPMPPAAQVPYRAASPRNWALRVEQTPVTVTAVMEATADAQLSHAVTTRVVLYRDQPYLDLEVTLAQKPADPWPEAGWICLPVKAPSPQFRLGRPGSIIDPAVDIVPGANRHMLAVNTGLTVTDPSGHGVGLCPLDHFLVSLERPGCCLYSRDFVPHKAVVFLNLFNNIWSTNFRMWNEGTWTSAVRVWAVDRYDADAALSRPALEARYPLLAATATGPGGTLPAVQSGLEVARPSVLVTALGANPDGAGTLLRLWEHGGISGDCMVRLPAGCDVTAVQPVDLRGRPAGQPLPVKDRAFIAPLRAFAPLSVVLGTTGKTNRTKP
jgi:hypothetical protein